MDFPICHLDLEVSADGKQFLYRAEGEPYIRLGFDTPGGAEYKRGSDGDILPDPFLEQLVFSTEGEAAFFAELTPRDGAVMRRGGPGEGGAILSQGGKPLIYGVNGLYDYDSDTLITWGGFPWRYTGERVVPEKGRDYVRLEGKIPAGGAAVFNLYFRYYGRHLGFGFHRPRERRFNPAPVAGWATWEAYRTGISQEKIDGAAAFLAEKLKPWGLEYIQIDDGWQSPLMPPDGPGGEPLSLKEGWLKTNEKFPGGHGGITAAIEKRGFIPALWTNAALNNRGYAEKSGRCIAGKDGKPLQGPWIGYVFDCGEESLGEIRELYRELAAKGYRYFKVDALRHLLYDGLMAAVREGLLSNEEALGRARSYLEAARRGIGEENYLLSCWGVLSHHAGIADALRFATDASASRESFVMQIGEAARWHFTHGVLYRNDPDSLCLRMESPSARALASLFSLQGWVYMLSDDVELYTGEKLEIARKTLPPTGAVSAEGGPLDPEGPMNLHRNIIALRGDLPSLARGSLWAAHFAQEGRTWAVIQVLRPSPVRGEETLRIPLENLGLDPALVYGAFDFWEQKALGRAEGALELESPGAFGGRVIALTPLRHPLEFIGSSRHVSMDLVSVKALRREGSSLALDLEGIPGESFDYWFSLPGGEAPEALCTGGKVSASLQDGCLCCSLAFEEKRAELILK
jgi:alpha-galactosidase